MVQPQESTPFPPDYLAKITGLSRTGKEIQGSGVQISPTLILRRSPEMTHQRSHRVASAGNKPENDESRGTEASSSPTGEHCSPWGARGARWGNIILARQGERLSLGMDL